MRLYPTDYNIFFRQSEPGCAGRKVQTNFGHEKLDGQACEFASKFTWYLDVEFHINILLVLIWFSTSTRGILGD